jgi:hypothetical protein
MPETASAPAKAPMSEFGRLLGIIIEPRPAFQDIAQRPRWIVPVAIMLLVGLAFSFAMSSHIGWERIVRQQMESSGQLQNVPADQRDRQIEMGIKMAPIFGYAAPAVAVPVILLISAGAAMLFTNLVFGAGLAFKQIFAVCSYASLVGIIKSLELLAVMLLKDPADFDPQQGTIFDLGFYVASSAPKWLASLAGSIDLFTIWAMLLTATGLSAASRRLSWGKGLTAAMVPWLVWVVLKVGWAAIRG